MPEAVIVDAVRTPIGRAVKGSLKDVRADDLAAVPLKALVERNPEVDFRETDDLMMGCGFQAGEQGYNIGRNAAAAGRDRSSRPRHDRQPLLCLVAADDPDGLPRDRGRRGRPVHRRRRRGRLALRGRQLPVPPAARRLRGRAVQRLHPDGPDRRERRRALQRLARVPGRVGRDLAAARRRRPRLGPLRPRDRRGRRSRRTRSPRDDGPRPGTTVEKLAELKPAFKPDGTVTAGNACPLERRRRGRARDVGREGGGARAQAARPHHRLLRRRRSAPRSWASARSPRSRRCWSRPA